MKKEINNSGKLKPIKRQPVNYYNHNQGCIPKLSSGYTQILIGSSAIIDIFRIWETYLEAKGGPLSVYVLVLDIPT